MGSSSWSRAEEELPFEDGEFDLIHSKDSLHHMEDPDKAIREYRRVLKARGRGADRRSEPLQPNLLRAHDEDAGARTLSAGSAFMSSLALGFPTRASGASTPITFLRRRRCCRSSRSSRTPWNAFRVCLAAHLVQLRHRLPLAGGQALAARVASSVAATAINRVTIAPSERQPFGPAAGDAVRARLAATKNRTELECAAPASYERAVAALELPPEM